MMSFTLAAQIYMMVEMPTELVFNYTTFLVMLGLTALVSGIGSQVATGDINSKKISQILKGQD